MRNHGFKETTISLNVVLSSYGLPTQPARKSTILALVELAVNEYYYSKSTGITISKLVAFPAFPTKIASPSQGVPWGHAAFGRLPKQETGRRGRSPPNNPNPSRWRSFPPPPAAPWMRPVGAVNSCRSGDGRFLEDSQKNWPVVSSVLSSTIGLAFYLPTFFGRFLKLHFPVCKFVSKHHNLLTSI